MGVTPTASGTTHEASGKLCDLTVLREYKASYRVESQTVTRARFGAYLQSMKEPMNVFSQ